jgi:uncharacterized protein YoxC
MFATSKDILYLVIAFCVLWATAFFCWMLYYVMRILKNASEIVEELRTRLEKLTEAIDYIRGKVEQMSGLMSVVTGGVSGLVQKVVRKKTKEWVDDAEEKFDTSAKDAVDRAVAATADKMRRMSKKIRK